MGGYYRSIGGYKLSHTNSMSPFYSDLEKQKKKEREEKIKELAKQPKKTIDSYDDIKIFKVPFKLNI